MRDKTEEFLKKLMPLLNEYNAVFYSVSVFYDYHEVILIVDGEEVRCYEKALGLVEAMEMLAEAEAEIED